MKSKVLLINPPQNKYKYSSSFGVSIPIGLLGIASSIRDVARVDLLDCLVYRFEVRQFISHCRFGSSLENIERKIEEYQPDVIGINMSFSAQINTPVSICNLIREKYPQTTIVLGGAHATVSYEGLLRKNICDFVIVGEGEFAFRELVQRLNDDTKEVSSVPGVASLNSSNHVTYTRREMIKNLDELPFPAYDLIDVQEYFNHPYYYAKRSHHKRSFPVLTSRGCPFTCSFCSIHTHMGKAYRAHSPGYVISHIKYLVDQFGIQCISFEDDNLSFDASRFYSILDGVASLDNEVVWETPNGIRVDTITAEVVRKMKESRCHHITLAIESGDQNTLDRIICKSIKLPDVIKTCQALKDARIKVSSFFMIGLPGETISSMRRTTIFAIKLFLKYNVFPQLLFATPLPGTSLYNTVKSERILSDNISEEDFANATQTSGIPLIETGEFSRRDLKKIVLQFKVKLFIAIMIYLLKNPCSLICKFIKSIRTRNLLLWP